MTEFDATGFAAIDQFFGNGRGDNATSSSLSKRIVPQPPSNGPMKGNHRRGVGSAPPVNPLQSSDFTKKVLAVGRKRRRGDDHDDDEDVDDPINDDANEESDDDEDNAGRTAILSPRNSSTKDTNSTIVPELKKKLGKKARKKLRQEPSGESSPPGDGSAIENPSGCESIVVAGDEETTPEEEKTSKKQKRRKVRSRQKNIRKDNRERDQKPDHLIVGRRNYDGRPLTAETRAKLNLPAPKIRSPFSTSLPPQEDDDGQMVGGGGLAVDDLLGEDDTGVVVPTLKGSQLSDTKIKKKSKKPKYKNLKV